jgi:hypothetical protein
MWQHVISISISLVVAIGYTVIYAIYLIASEDE